MPSPYRVMCDRCGSRIHTAHRWTAARDDDEQQCHTCHNGGENA